MSIIRKMLLTSIILLLCFSIAACGSNASGGATDYSKAPVPKGVDPQETAMTVNGYEVKVSDYLSFMRYFKRATEMQMGYTPGSKEAADFWNQDEDSSFSYEELADTQVKNQLEQLAIMQQLAQELGVTFTEEDKQKIDTNIDSMINSYGSNKDFVEQTGIYPEDYKSVVMSSAIAGKVIEHLYGYEGIEKTHVTKDDVKKQYSDNYVRIKHVLIVKNSSGQSSDTESKSEGSSDRTDAQAKKLAEDILAKAKAGEDFDRLISEYGEDPGTASYPEGYVFTRNEMTQEFEEAAFAMKIGEMRLVESGFGYHVMLKLDHNESDLFSQYEEDIYGSLTSEKGAEYINSKMSEAKVEYNEDALKKIKFKDI